MKKYGFDLCCRIDKQVFISVVFALNYGLLSLPPNTPLLRENPLCRRNLHCRKHNKPTRSNM
jgi:hypothetical protein